ncbi:MAG: hypothetical protein M3150_00005, partial [Pseudomonadota bacterium]|nr:hypothetical protein [Pseudomonadota bacterium]
MLPGPAKWRDAADELVRQHWAREAFAALHNDLAPDSVPAAYLIQDNHVARLLEQRQTSLAGYKIAITTAAMRDMVGFHDSVSGRLLRDQVYRSGHRVQARDFVRLIVEFEIAFE